MRLQENIQYYRRQARLSQEELAARVGVSRQAVSKWELGDATPEVEKLVALAQVFGVSTDVLLGREQPNPPPQAGNPSPGDDPPPFFGRNGGWLGRLIRRWGWLAGVYIAFSGLGIALVGGLSRLAFGRMFQITAGEYFSSLGFDMGSVQGVMELPVGISATGEVFLTIAAVILAVGVAIAIGGAILAVVLWQKGRRSP